MLLNEDTVVVTCIHDLPPLLIALSVEKITEHVYLCLRFVCILDYIGLFCILADLVSFPQHFKLKSDSH